MYRNDPHPVYLADYRPPEFLIETVDLRFELDPALTRVESALSVRRNPAAIRGDGSLTLDGEGLELEWIRIDGRELTPAEYARDAQGLTIHRVADRFELRTRVAIRPERNTALEGLYQSGEMLCTQCEAEGFRRITYYLDRPDVMARFTTTLIADAARYPVLLANGNPQESRQLDDGRHLARWDDPFPKPCYLFALVAGDLRAVEDHFTTCSGREIALRLYVEPQNLDKCDHAMRSLKQAMRWDEERFGREYDLDIFMIVAVSHFNMGAMENKGLNIFNDKYVLARPNTATDTDFQHIEGVIGHEYFHNWSGNRVTCRDWFQLSLKEGFTVYRDQEFSADLGSRAVKRIQDVRLLRNHQFAEDASPMAHPVRPESYIEINNFYTTTVYEKGAELVRMLALLLGAQTFRRATDLYFARHDAQAVTTEDFVCCMEEASGRDLTQFRRWYAQSGTPELHVETEHDPERGLYQLRVRQHTPPTPGQPEKAPLHLPFALALFDAEGRELAVRLADEPPGRAPGARVLELTEAETCWSFVDLPERPVPSLLRGFSAPVKLHTESSDADLLFLLAHDSDGFNRWDSAQILWQRLLLRLVAEPDTTIPDALFEALRCALTDSASDQALLAEVLTLPSESYLGDQMEEVDVEGIERARATLEHAIGTQLGAELRARCRDLAEPDTYSLAPEAIGRRALRNRALEYLVRADDPESTALCRTQFEQAQNMTDQHAALRLLFEQDTPMGEAALEVFHRRWRHESLVIDKWFALQAASRRNDTLARVIALSRHEDFTLSNPNRVRSLIGTFSAHNPARFHDPDGGGYRFLAERVLELDARNPQIAARLLRPLIGWRRYDARRRELMRTEIERVVRHPRLSRDLYEVASKALASE